MSRLQKEGVAGDGFECHFDNENKACDGRETYLIVSSNKRTRARREGGFRETKGKLSETPTGAVPCIVCFLLVNIIIYLSPQNPRGEYELMSLALR